MFIKTIQECFLISFLTSGTIFWSVIIDSVLTCVTRCPISEFILFFFFNAVAGVFAVILINDYLIAMSTCTLYTFRKMIDPH